MLNYRERSGFNADPLGTRVRKVSGPKVGQDPDPVTPRPVRQRPAPRRKIHDVRLLTFCGRVKLRPALHGGPQIFRNRLVIKRIPYALRHGLPPLRQNCARRIRTRHRLKRGVQKSRLQRQQLPPGSRWTITLWYSFGKRKVTARSSPEAGIELSPTIDGYEDRPTTTTDTGKIDHNSR